MNPIPQEGEREEFEAMARRKGFDLNTHLFDDSVFLAPSTQLAWSVWQDRAALHTERTAPEAAASSDSSDAYMAWFKKQPSGGNTWMAWQAAVEWVASKPAALAPANVSDSGAEPVRQLRSVWDVTQAEQDAMRDDQWSAWKAELRAADQGAMQVSELLTAVEEMQRDAREVYNLPEISQDVRDAIEYCASWMTVYIEKRASTTPQPMTDDAIDVMIVDRFGIDADDEILLEFARAIERHHGIGASTTRKDEGKRP